MSKVDRIVRNVSCGVIDVELANGVVTTYVVPLPNLEKFGRSFEYSNTSVRLAELSTIVIENGELLKSRF